jgi:hypothetical protein
VRLREVATLVPNNIRMLYFRYQVDLLSSEHFDRTAVVKGNSLDGCSLWGKDRLFDSSVKSIMMCRRRTHLAVQTRDRSKNRPKPPFPDLLDVLVMVVDAFFDEHCG